MAPLLADINGIKLLIQSREHLPPHIHALYGDDEALIDIRTSEIVAGSLPPKKLKIVKEWLAKEKNRAIIEENFYELNPRLRVTIAKKGKRKGGKE